MHALVAFFDTDAERRIVGLLNNLGVEQSHRPHLSYAAANVIGPKVRKELREDLDRLWMPDLWPHTLGTVCNDVTQREKCLVSLLDDGLVEQTRDGLFALPGEH